MMVRYNHYRFTRLDFITNQLKKYHRTMINRGGFNLSHYKRSIQKKLRTFHHDNAVMRRYYLDL